MNIKVLASIFLVMMLSFQSLASADSMNSFGFGVQYFRALGDIKSDRTFDKDGLGYNFSYRLRMGLLALEAMVQMYPNGWYDAKHVYTPKLFALFGKGIYGGVGVLTNNVTWRKDDPFHDLHHEWTAASYQLRAGVQSGIIFDVLVLDVNANYLFNNWSEVKNFDEDSLEFGASVRVNL